MFRMALGDCKLCLREQQGTEKVSRALPNQSWYRDSCRWGARLSNLRAAEEQVRGVKEHSTRTHQSPGAPELLAPGCELGQVLQEWALRGHTQSWPLNSVSWSLMPLGLCSCRELCSGCCHPHVQLTPVSYRATCAMQGAPPVCVSCPPPPHGEGHCVF